VHTLLQRTAILTLLIIIIRASLVLVNSQE